MPCGCLIGCKTPASHEKLFVASERPVIGQRAFCRERHFSHKGFSLTRSSEARWAQLRLLQVLSWDAFTHTEWIADEKSTFIFLRRQTHQMLVHLTSIMPLRKSVYCCSSIWLRMIWINTRGTQISNWRISKDLRVRQCEMSWCELPEGGGVGGGSGVMTIERDYRS